MIETESTQITGNGETDFEFWIEKGVPYSIVRLDCGSLLGSICIPETHRWYNETDLSFYPDYRNAQAIAEYGRVKRIKQNGKVLPDSQYRQLALLTGFHIKSEDDEWSMEKMEDFLRKLAKLAKRKSYVNFRRHPLCKYC